MLFYLLETATATANATATSAATPWWEALPGAVGLSVIISGVVGGILGAYYQPVIKDYLGRRQLRHNLYRELVNFYELVQWHIREEEDLDKQYFITPSSIYAATTSYPFNSSVLQSQKNPQIWRSTLKDKLFILGNRVALLKKILDNSLSIKIQSDQDKRQLFYQLDESSLLDTTFGNFLAINDTLPAWRFIPTTPLLTQDEAKNLYNAETQFDRLKAACAAFEAEEDERELDTKLLNKMRGWKERGTIYPTYSRADVTARWCGQCAEFVRPLQRTGVWKFARYYANWFFNINSLKAVLSGERCPGCSRILPTNVKAIEETCTQLSKYDARVNVLLEQRDPKFEQKVIKTLDTLCQATDYDTSHQPLVEAVGTAVYTALSRNIRIKDYDEQTIKEYHKVKCAALECIGNNCLPPSFLFPTDPSAPPKVFKGARILAVGEILKDLDEDRDTRKKAAWVYGQLFRSNKCDITNHYGEIALRKTSRCC
ncbi:MAG: hypothetical protein ACXVIZ_10310, partial [Halobacteriota archaeon]